MDDAPKSARYRIHDPADQRFILLRKEGLAPDEAARIAYGLAHPSSSESPAETPAGETRPQPPQDELAGWRDRLATIDEQLAESGAEEGLMNEDILTLMKERGDLVADIKTEQRFREREQRNRQAQAAGRLNAALRDNKATAEQRFPSISDAQSDVCREADRLTTLYHGTAVMQDPAAPMQIAEQAVLNVARARAAAHGTSIAAEFARLEASAQQASAPAQQQHQSVKTLPAARRITPASGASATRRPDQPASEEQRLHAAQAASDPRTQHEQLERLLYGS